MKKKGSKKVEKKFDIELKELKSIVELPSDQHQELSKHGNVAGICEKLHVDPMKGLSSSNEQDLCARSEQFGRNELPTKPDKTIFYFILQALRIKLLLGLVIITLLYSIISQLVFPSGVEINSGQMDYFYLSLSHDVCTLAILLIVMFCVACYEWIKEGELRILRSKVETDDVVGVLRDGQVKQLRARELVVGDVCEIGPGSTLPADGLVIESNGLKIDESNLTGETNFVPKGPDSPILYSGTIVNEGTGRMLVTAVGVHSQTGIIISLLGNANNGRDASNRIEIKVLDGNEVEQGEAQTMLNSNQANRDSNSLKNKVTKLNKIIGLIGFSLTICTFVVLVVRFFVRHFVQHHMLQFMLRYLSINLTLLFVIAPESLPLLYTWSISNTIERMIKNNCLVRHLISIEHLAEATTLCIGKLSSNNGPDLSGLCGKLKKAGLVVRLVSEEDTSTARSIALTSGLVEADEDFLVLEAEEFLKQPSNDMWPRVKVIANAKAYDKCNVVKQMKRLNEIVAVVAETSADAASLKQADVGFAMGLMGSPVAKEASDIILTDDDLNSVLSAVLCSRNVYDSIVRLLQFQFTVNSVIVCTSLLGACLFGDVVLGAWQILWINLIILSLGIISLLRDGAKKDELLDRQRYARLKANVSRFVLKYFLGQLFYQMLVTLFNLIYAPYLLDTGESSYDSAPSKHYTMIFNSLVLMNLFNEINCRNIHTTRNIFLHIQRNIVFSVQWIVLLCLQVLIVQFGQSLFWCKQLNLFQWLWCLVFAFGSLIWTQLIAFIPTDKSSN